MNKGQDVICINDNFTEQQIKGIPNRPVKDKLYTIRDIFLTTNGMAVHLKQITNPHLEHPSGLGTFEPCFNANRFIPITENKIEEEEVEMKELQLII